MAEFENFRKRTEKEKSQMFDMGAKTIVRSASGDTIISSADLRLYRKTKRKMHLSLVWIRFTNNSLQH
mgnify:CR=1 FL=1